MDQFLKECPGCIGITDDITVHACTEAECDTHLQNLMWVAHKYGVVFNLQKTHVKAPAVNFFGCLYNANGVHLDLEKVNAVHALPAPTNVTELPRVPRHGDIPQPLHPWPVHSDCSFARGDVINLMLSSQISTHPWCLNLIAFSLKTLLLSFPS